MTYRIALGTARPSAAVGGPGARQHRRRLPQQRRALDNLNALGIKSGVTNTNASDQRNGNRHANALG